MLRREAVGSTGFVPLVATFTMAELVVPLPEQDSRLVAGWDFAGGRQPGVDMWGAIDSSVEPYGPVQRESSAVLDTRRRLTGRGVARL